MSDSDSSSSSSSSLPSPSQITAKLKEKKSKTKETKTKTKSRSKAAKSGTISEPQSRPEDDPTWAYKPPEGMVMIENVGDNGLGDEWDWDTFKKSELELWVIRVPSGLKPKHLENLAIDLPEPFSSKKNTKVGTLNRKHESYDVWNLGSGSGSSSNATEVDGVEVGQMIMDDSNDPAAAVGGDEMKGLTCLLPRKKKPGEFYIAPRTVTRHLVVATQPPKPSPAEDAQQSILTQNPPRFSYPKELLKHRFVAFGSTTDAAEVDDVDDDKMDVDPPPSQPPPPASPRKNQETVKAKKLEKETKKRKKEEEAEMRNVKKQKKLKQ
ncbi:hypothetical protein BDP27DRAFT_1270063 [Rhodocollybia butyracea]|uniref:Uncharacterized protein n=1 Tax=Rhodocollybia butyracea TaxID=206335 RepID=A0A9P5PJR7_9AGAR|nr:hypothetical protein BDP27DRAFT_1270063 [Rhodocollybia butyracea]